jgi:hypothetical protein
VKPSFLLFLMCSWAALTPGAACADLSSSASQQTSPEGAATKVNGPPGDAARASVGDGGKHQKEGMPSVGPQGHSHLSGKNHPRSPAAITKDHPKQPPNNRERSLSGNAMNFHPPGTDKRKAAAKSGLIQRDTVHSPLHVRAVSVIRPTLSLRNNVRHHGANPAAMGGPANSAGRNTAAINGTSVHRRP